MPARRLLTFGLLLVVTATAFEATAVVTAMPAAAEELGDLHLYAWAFTAVMIAQLVSIAVAGRLVDRAGPIRPFLGGMVLCVLGVVVAALAPTMAVLLVGRFIQGLGGGAVYLTLMVVTALAYDPAARARVMTWYSACWMLPAFVGPALAAWLSQNLSWHWVFWAVLPLFAVGLACMTPGLRSLPDHIEDEGTDPVPVSAAMGVAAGLALIQVAGQRLEPLSWLWLGLGLGALALWFGRLMPRGFSPAAGGLSAVVGVRLLTSGTFFGVQSFLPLMLTARGTPLAVAGLVITLSSVGWMAGSWLQARPWLRLSRDRIILVGGGCVAAGIAVCVGAAVWTSVTVPLSLAGFSVVGLGMGLQSTSTSLAAMQLSTGADLGRNTSSLQVGEMAGNALLGGLAGTLFVALEPTADSPTTFGWLMGTLALLAGLGVWMAGRIGHLENHSLR